MYNIFFSFLNPFNLLYTYQFGFSEKHGPNMALTVLVDEILKALNEGKIVLGVFLDLSKAFDTVFRFLQIFFVDISMNPLKTQTNFLYT